MAENELDGIEKNREEEKAKLNLQLSKIKSTIMVMSGKGGVGKSTVSANLALSLAREGFRVGVLDGDIHGPDIPKILGVEDMKLTADEEGKIRPVTAYGNIKVISVGYLIESRDTPVIWRGPMKHSVMRQFLKDVNWGELDFLVVDLPPGTGDEPLSIAQLIRGAEGVNAPYALIVTTPQDVALLDARKSVEFARALDLKILGIIENMSGLSCPHCGETIDLFKTGGGRKAAEDLHIPFLGAVPIDPRIVRDTDEGRPFVVSEEGLEAAKAFAGIVSDILKQI
ncbi:MAG TPA: Mrp/NBP35 family ATP-binding protein [Deltaproteobacteria bacterium]|jgi:Mrp family chromosome partitioning ATPase|nr:Mrp/NBP35 family ATP-binding protein [Deltaproteobacteria bacterium]HQJ07993.1 Mrp/NBP35 family ATP-binding protein [Deltaproteobacteria bacterium]